MNKLILSVIFTSSTLFGFAQQNDTAKNVLDEVVVTANKYPQKQSTTGKVITVISKQQIENNAGKTISQLLNQQAGIVINGALNNMGSVQTIYTRGASSGRTLILLDGIPVSDPSMINNEFDLNLFSLDNVDRIEVCKGAQSTLYGSDAIAGVINIITVDKNIAGPLKVKSTLSGGSFGTVKGNVQVSGKAGSLVYSARYAALRTDGFSAAYDSTGIKSYDRDGYKGNVANAQLLWQLTPQLSLKTFAMLSNYKADIDAGIFADEKDYGINNSNINSGFGFLYKTDLVSLTANYQYSDNNRRYLNDSGFKSNTIFEKNDYFSKSQFVEVYSSIHVAKGFTLLHGADFRRHSFNQNYFSVSSFGPYKSNFKDTSLSQTGLYSSLNYSGADNKLNVELGGRLNSHSRYGSNSTFTFNPSYAVLKNARIFGSVASGFKAPSLYQLSINSKLLPEKSINYEAGVQFNNTYLNTRLVYFSRKIDNGIDYNYITFKYFNYIKQLVNGIEYEVNVTPVKSVNISANYTYISPKETTQNRITNLDTITYNYVLRRPKHNANASISWQITNKLSAEVNGKYVSKRQDVGGYKKADVTLNSYTLMGAHASYIFNTNVSTFVDAQNIFNKKFFDVRGYNAIPCMVNAGVTLSW